MTLPLPPPQVASSLNNLGVVLEAMGRYDEALDALNQCHTLQLQLLSADHPDLAATLNNLGKVLHRTAKHDEALVMLREALRLRERSFGLIHPKVRERNGNAFGNAPRERGSALWQLVRSQSSRSGTLAGRSHAR